MPVNKIDLTWNSEKSFFVQIVVSDRKRKKSVPGTKQPSIPLISDSAFTEPDKFARTVVLAGIVFE